MQEKTLDNTVRTNIIKIMKAKKISVKDIYKEANNIAMSTIYKHLRGDMAISLKKVEQMSKILDIDYRLLVEKNLIVKEIKKVIIERNNVQSDTKEQIQREKDRSEHSDQSDV
jgi:hypothetical protein